MVTVIIPMAGEGARFKAVGYKVPKPFIPVKGTPMIDRVLDTLPKSSGTVNLIGREEHETLLTQLCRRRREFLSTMLLKNKTDGAATTIAQLSLHIPKDDAVLIINCDNLIPQEDLEELVAIGRLSRENAVLLFNATGYQWSYAEVVGDHVVRVAEKKRISPWATAGAYYFYEWGEFLAGYEAMVATDDRTNGEFYLAPIYNYTKRATMAVYMDPAKFKCMGTPEDVENFVP